LESAESRRTGRDDFAPTSPAMGPEVT